MIMRNLEFTQSLEKLGDVDIFFGGLYGKSSKETFCSEVFKRSLLLVCNRSHKLPSGLPQKFSCEYVDYQYWQRRPLEVGLFYRNCMQQLLYSCAL